MTYAHHLIVHGERWNLRAATGAWERLLGDARAIHETCQALGIGLADGWGEGDAAYDRESIWLNGVAGDDLAGEPFLLPAERRHAEPVLARQWVNTRRQPYDLAVCSILLRAIHHFRGALAVASDGSWGHEWAHGAWAWGDTSEPGGPAGYWWHDRDGELHTIDIGARRLCFELFEGDTFAGIIPNDVDDEEALIYLRLLARDAA